MSIPMGNGAKEIGGVFLFLQTISVTIQSCLFSSPLSTAVLSYSAFHLRMYTRHVNKVRELISGPVLKYVISAVSYYLCVFDDVILQFNSPTDLTTWVLRWGKTVLGYVKIEYKGVTSSPKLGEQVGGLKSMFYKYQADFNDGKRDAFTFNQ